MKKLFLTLASISLFMYMQGMEQEKKESARHGQQIVHSKKEKATVGVLDLLKLRTKVEFAHRLSNGQLFSYDKKSLYLQGLNIASLEHLKEFISASHSNVSTIDSVRLSENALTSLKKKDLECFSRLSGLDLGSNKINLLAEDTFSDKSILEYLWISSNMLTKLSGNLFVLCKKLKSLRLNHNYLQELPATIFYYCPLLEILDVSDNYLKGLSADALKYNTRLTSLTLSNNRLTDISDSMPSEYPTLQYVDLDNNPLVKVPEKAVMAPQLSKLCIENTPYIRSILNLMVNDDSIDDGDQAKLLSISTNLPLVALKAISQGGKWLEVLGKGEPVDTRGGPEPKYLWLTRLKDKKKIQVATLKEITLAYIRKNNQTFSTKAEKVLPQDLKEELTNV